MSLPLQPSEVPLRVIVVSPFTKDETIIQKAKIAAMKKNCTIDPKAIELLTTFDFELLERNLSPSMFTMTSTANDEAEPEIDGSSHEVAEEEEYSSGGSSLLRTHKEVEEIVVTAATVTIGGDTPAESNVHGKVVEAFPDKVNLSTQMCRISTHIDVLLSNILPPSGQFNFFLSGSGGTALHRQSSYLSFGRRSGMAGCTLHAALGIDIDMNPPEPNSNHIQAWSEIGIMFLDEFSTIKPSLYFLTNNRLQKIKGRFDKPFGGVHVISSGDFYQLSPIDSFIFSTPTQYDNEKDANAIESMRAVRHIAAVNNRVVDDLDLSIERLPLQTVIAVTQNDHRETVMRYFETRINEAVSGILTESDHDWRRRGILLVQARVSQTEGHQKVRPQ
ncbi:hypothetical protein GHT06_018476 [Daphnia sinensis]|uniref:ATP-dependent DNA helicase n=1 Tax=Daphnia sinensis TaxID=1820382 RepID=A0AAD5KNV8_9CRUS|nr:hypothetical protein GHT06_018476 [Daphnia sinensis]